MLPIRAALTGRLTHTGVIGTDILPVVERSPVSLVLPDIESSGVSVTGIFQPPARCAVLRPLLTSLQVAPSGSPHVRTRCFPARPPHLPARPNRATSLCCASSSRRARPSMRFLSVSPLVSASLPSPGRLPSRGWPRVVGLSCFHAVPPTGDLHPIYNAPMMGAHNRLHDILAPLEIMRRRRSPEDEKENHNRGHGRAWRCVHHCRMCRMQHAGGAANPN